MRDFVTWRGAVKLGAMGCFSMGRWARVVGTKRGASASALGWESCARGVALSGDSGDGDWVQVSCEFIHDVVWCRHARC
jgi:hypothetical protein